MNLLLARILMENRRAHRQADEGMAATMFEVVVRESDTVKV